MASITRLSLILRHLNQSANKSVVRDRWSRHTTGASHFLRSFSQQNNDYSSSESPEKTTSAAVKDMETLFLMPKVQTLLKRLIGFDEHKVFEMTSTLAMRTNEYRFMTDKELEMHLELARKAAEERLQMPPVCRPQEDKPRVLEKDPLLQGYLDSKYIFVDSSSGYSDQTRLIVVRETNGILREANREERYRMNQMFFPKEERCLETPKMFFEPHLTDVLNRHEYEFVLERACLQFEPNDPQFIDVCNTTYDHISDAKEFARLQSTRHFGPFSLYLAFKRKIDNLLNHFILNEAINEASDLCHLFYLIHSSDKQLLEDIDSQLIRSLDLVKKYIKEESKDKSFLELSLQKYEELQKNILRIKL